MSWKVFYNISGLFGSFNVLWIKYANVHYFDVPLVSIVLLERMFHVLIFLVVLVSPTVVVSATFSFEHSVHSIYLSAFTLIFTQI